MGVVASLQPYQAGREVGSLWRMLASWTSQPKKLRGQQETLSQYIREQPYKFPIPALLPVRTYLSCLNLCGCCYSSNMGLVVSSAAASSISSMFAAHGHLLDALSIISSCISSSSSCSFSSNSSSSPFSSSSCHSPSSSSPYSSPAPTIKKKSTVLEESKG